MSKIPITKKVLIKKFNSKVFDFRKIVLNKLLDENILPKKKNIDLNVIHRYLTTDKVQIAIEKMYEVFRSKKFQKLYDNFSKKIIYDNNFGKNTRYQLIPTARIMMPGMKTVNFHNDQLYGHGKNIINLWVPLTKTEKSNSVQIVDEKNSKNLIKLFKRKKSTIYEMNLESLKKSKSMKLNYGEYLVFSGTTIHGALMNKTNKTRVSIDFRMVRENDDIGVKDNSFFIKIGQRKVLTNTDSKKKRVACYVSRTKNNSHLPSQKYQQLICVQYCKDQNLFPVLLDTELSDFDYYPVLTDLIEGTWKNYFSHLVVFSRNNFPKKRKIYNKILKKIKKSQKTLHFVLEDQIIYGRT